MKIRKGFVSNSSSSSFVVAFPKGFVPTAENVKDLLFPGQTVLNFYDYEVGTAEAARVIADSMSEQKPNDDDNIFQSMGGWLEGSPSFDDFHAPGSSQINWDDYDKAAEAHREKVLSDFRQGLDADVYVFEFSDNDGSFYSTLEHGPTFDNVKHIRISNH